MDQSKQPATSRRRDRLVVVPRRAGLVAELEPERRRTPDELDQLIDELFGEATTEPPGAFDAMLLGGGGALVGFAVLTNDTGAAMPLGIASVVLGSALPGRSLLRRLRSRREATRARRAIGDGVVLATGHSSSDELLEAHRRLLAAAAGPAGGDSQSVTLEASEAVAAAHLALIEVATLLGGRLPATASETEYVDRRTEAIRAIAWKLERAERARRTAVEAARRAAADEDADRTEALLRAREELEAETQLGALGQLRLLSSRLGEIDRVAPD